MTRPPSPAVVVVGDAHPLVGVRWCSVCGEEAKGRRGLVLQLIGLTAGSICPLICETCVADCAAALDDAADDRYMTGAEFLAAADALNVEGDPDDLVEAEAPALRLAVVPSSQLPGALSLRAVDAEGRVTGHLKGELNDAGFEPGDLVEVVLVRRATAGGAR